MTNEVAKVTKKDYYNNIIQAMKTGEVSIDPVDIIAFCENEIAMLDKKAEKAKERAAAKKADGDALTDAVKAALTNEFTITADITMKVAEALGDDAEVTVHRVQYRLTQLAKAGEAEVTDMKIEATETSKARTLKAYRVCNA